MTPPTEAATPTLVTSDTTLWDPTDVADYLKVSRSWVYQKVMSGKLPVMRIEGLLRFKPEAVRAWAMGERKDGSTVQPVRRPRQTGGQKRTIGEVSEVGE